jgi:hypothetical protein
MVNHVGIYGFCLFKQKNVVRADGSINTNMYGLKPALVGVRWAVAKEISKEEGPFSLIPSSTFCFMLRVRLSAEKCVRVSVDVA